MGDSLLATPSGERSENEKLLAVEDCRRWLRRRSEFRVDSFEIYEIDIDETVADAGVRSLKSARDRRCL